MVGVVILVGILVWAGATLLIGCYQIRRVNRRLDVAERVIRERQGSRSEQPVSLAEEAYDWLQRQ